MQNEIFLNPDLSLSLSFSLSYIYIGVQLGGVRGGGLPCLFLKIKRKCPGFRKKAQIVPILMLNLLFKM